MSDISPSKLGEQFDAEFQAKLDACTTPEMIKALMHDHAINQKLVVPDIYDANVLLPVNTPQPRAFAKAVTVNGVKHVIEGATETELAQNEVALYHKLFQPAATGTEQPRDPATGQFRATAEQQRAATAADDGAAEAARQGNLRADMLAGKISVDEYALQSGAIERALASAGIDPEALREVSHQKYEQNWASATEEFLRSSDWPGGSANLKRLGDRLIEIGATEKPSVETLRLAYDHLKKNNLLVANEELAREKKIAEARTPQELRSALGYQGNTLWNR